MKRIITVILLLTFYVLNVCSQTDTEFWFAAPRLTPNHNNKDIVINIITFDQPGVVTISQPAAPESSFNQTVTIPASSYYSLRLGSSSGPLANVETLFGAVRNTGFLITSDVPIQAYYASTTNNSEVYSLKGRNALGIDFIVPSQTDRANSTGGYSGGKNSVEIVASEDDTVVEITPSNDCEGGIKKGVTFSVTLNRGQSYAISAQGTSAAEHLHNTRVKSNKPVAVNYTDDTVAGPGADMLGDQLIPISKLGKNYIIVANYKKAIGSDLTEKAYVFPTEDNTTMYVNSVQQTIVNLGDSWSYDLKANNMDAIQLTSDKPVLVLHVTSYDNELGCAVLPPIDCTGSREIAYKSAFGTPYFDVITKKENIDAFMVNGNSYLLPPQVFQPVNDDDIWYYAVRPISVSGLIHVENTKGYFHVGAYDVAANTCSLGYFSSFNTMVLGAETDNAYYHTGDAVHFSLKDETDIIGYYWEGPNGFVSYDSNPVINAIDESGAGRYIVSASHRDGCPIEPDTFYVHVFPQPEVEQHSICYGNDLTLSAPGDAPYLWSTGETTATIKVSPTAATDYSVVSRREGFENRAQFDLSHYYHVEVLDSLRPQITGDMEICHGEADLKVSGTYDSYQWSTGATTSSIVATEAGEYWVRVTQGDCFGTGYYRVDPAPVLNVEFSPTVSVCEAETVLNIPYRTKSGALGSYDTDYSVHALSSGFVNETNLTPQGGDLVINIPSGVGPGVYKVRLHLHEALCGYVQEIDVEMMVKYSSAIIEQRWSDVLGVLNSEYNGGHNFVGYQWYKDGVALEGEDKSYYHEDPWLAGSSVYAVLLTGEDGLSVFTCDFTPSSVATPGSGETGRIARRGEVVVFPGNIEAGQMSIWSLSGVLYGRYEVGKGDVEVQLPQVGGVYVVDFPDGRRYKIVVK